MPIRIGIGFVPSRTIDVARLLVVLAYVFGLAGFAWTLGLFMPLLEGGLIALIVTIPLILISGLVGFAGGVLAIVTMMRTPLTRTAGNVVFATAGIVGPLWCAWYFRAAF